MFCSHCGKEIEDGLAQCPECGAQLTTEKKKSNIKITPTLALTTVFSFIALFLGFILTTISLAKGWGVNFIEYYTVVPALIGLGCSVFKFFEDKTDKPSKLIYLICMCACAFIVLYTFIGYMVLICG